MKPTKRDIVLQMLRDAGPAGVNHDQFLRAGIARHSARVDELRSRGHVIDVVCIDRRSGSWKSTLRHDATRNLKPKPEPQVYPTNLFDPKPLKLEDVA
jgi:hypothetical protein